MKLYDRKRKIYIEEKESKLLYWLYTSIVGRAILKVLTLNFISKLVAIFMKSHFSRRLIKKYSEDDYYSRKYKSFNDFFTRKKDFLYDTKDNKLISPAESKLSVYNIDEDLRLDIKGTCYTMDEIIDNKELANKYKNGICLVFRLSPDNYHRYIFFDNVIQKEHKKMKRSATYS